MTEQERLAREELFAALGAAGFSGAGARVALAAYDGELPSDPAGQERLAADLRATATAAQLAQPGGALMPTTLAEVRAAALAERKRQGGRKLDDVLSAGGLL